MNKNYNPRNTTKKGYSVAKLPLYINNKFSGEYVLYMGDLSNEHYEIVTNKTYYYDVDFRKQYILVENDKIIVNDCYNARDYINENYYER